MESTRYTSSSMLTGGMRCYTNFMPSSETFATDVPEALGGRGELPTPAAMLAATLASCMLSMISVIGKRKNIPTDGICIKSRCQEEHDGITAFLLDIIVPFPVPNAERKIFEAGVLTCPVGKAIAPSIRRNITWNWAD